MKQEKLILQQQNNKCISCNYILKEKEDYELDHSKPISSGGTSDRKNKIYYVIPVINKKL